MIIAIDGPAGAGKSTVARLVARKLGFLYIDTGAMYRALTLAAIENNISSFDEAGLIKIAQGSVIDMRNQADGSAAVFLNGRDVSRAIREPRITKMVSDVAKIGQVREAMLVQQRKMGREQDAVLDGRDIGTVVFPHADHKFFIDARFEERVNRRYKECLGLGQGLSSCDVEKDLKNRDTIDSTREVAPLKKADDAVYVDTTNMTIEEVVEAVLSVIRKKA